MITAKELVPALNGKMPGWSRDGLSDLDRIVICTIAAGGDWVLVDRNRFSKQGQSSSVYIALRRRGFLGAVRHVDGVKNYWARWPHPFPTMPEMPEFKGDDGLFGAAS